MQDAILRLQRYWTERGCMIAQPYNTEVGAGTANPATMLRVLGPEPWRVGYVEPSVRPDDSRYGDNPNRLQTHTQFQVILKPDPGNPQELYLESLAALGIDLDAHDVRFVEDNWASPALGAWGLGWEVWLDGLEITQFTYFQQAGGIVLDPVSVEITYGLERIMMALQGVAHFKDIRFADGISYGEVFGQGEYEMSRYYLDDADVGTNRELYEASVREATRMVEAGLPVPAYNHVLRCSHVFNVLDARGAISTTERAAAFRTMRTLTRDVATLWVDRRAQRGHPLGLAAPPPPARADDVSGLRAQAPAPLLVEIGVEEVPWTDVRDVGRQLRDALTARLGGTRLHHGEVRVEATPRRFVLTVDEVAPREPGVREFVRGPKVSAAYAADGTPTTAALGFARSKGVDVAALEVVEVDGVEHVGATRNVVGREAPEVLAGIVAELVREMRSGRNMRWSDPELTFSRPIRWLVCMLGDQHLPVAVSALRSGTTTRVLRRNATPEVEVPTAAGYAELLARHGIILSRGQRRAAVVEQAVRLAASVGGHLDLEAQAELVDEITDLVEDPRAILGTFDERYMALPVSVLTTVMRKHQRYLAVTDADGALLPFFVTVANGACDEDAVRGGKEAVLRARYEDAFFFFEADLKVSPAQFRARLDALNFEATLGSMASRADRIARLAAGLGRTARLTPQDQAVVARAGRLAKFDLATQMVVELSSLAGTMASEYARHAGEDDEVALALLEMELPRTGVGALPASTPGRVLSLADRFDLLTGMMAVGNVPTGHSDPFGVRRAAIGVVNVLRCAPELVDVSLRDGVAGAAALLREAGLSLPEGLVEDTVALVLRRYELQLVEAGHDHRHVRAVLPRADRPLVADRDLATLAEKAGEPATARLVEALQRVLRILPATAPTQAPGHRLSGRAELALAEEVSAVESRLGEDPTLADFLAATGDLPGRIDTLFEEVLVMDPDPEVRAARLHLLGRIAGLCGRVLDWSAL
jgi:glycyl-tRNA synthetase